MPPPSLFRPLNLRKLVLPNRIAVAPMCQYHAVDGLVQPWHEQHYGALSVGGAGLIVMEATGVAPDARISAYDLGLWNDEQARAMDNIVRHMKSFGSSRIGIQLAHAGRKGAAPGDWETIAPSAIAFDDTMPAPRAMTEDDMDRVRQSFVDAALRAISVGFDVIELHAAHGYLLHQFLSPLSNHRSDKYGGSWENRSRFPLEVIAAVKAAVPADFPVGIRVSATDWVDGGLTVDESIAFARAYAKLGLDYVCVSSGGVVPVAPIPVGPGYQVPLARAIKAATGGAAAGLAVRAVGMISDPMQAESVLHAGDADWIAIGRGFLDDPRWVWRAAQRLGVSLAYPAPYERVSARLWQS